MKAVILAAGEGRRMRPLTETMPKQMVRVLGRTLLEYQLDVLPDVITELILVVGYKRNQIEDFLGDSWRGRPITYIEQKKPGGTAAALALCEQFLKNEPLFMVMYADDIHGKEGVRACVEKGSPCLLIDEVDDPRKFGVIETDSEGRIVRIDEKPEKPKSNLVSSGVLLLSNAIFSYVAQPRDGEEYIPDRIMAMLEDGHTFHTVRSSQWIVIGYPEDVVRAEDMLRNMV
ncbi:MAG: UTP--glucose-1-phosphate uridylyltransferase [Candidatus Ryanbacteria bacterium CG10_big_fil_rev_8_21_14_0_10_43_42]|uniref:UTP--glucose-1-phosphate uridylyltransferase n=1 Tax=Candidatus Ryanbacteria bacterium CG10_big_fil_rev_8_21_14_0_10_43_42 TaxID=1974864 RepID=A0A2M8KXZ3_9BACT|nr:MAG: UTP--glucose-1-phosphate uridylyltransferase [Candidatus Ryanbacteria bacterium CG10_big_fil_rev_8_21_14_0_10_43_42]